MTLEAYRTALAQAKKDLAAKIAEVGEAERTVEIGTKQIVELRQTIAVLAKLCGEPEYVEEDALGITDVVRMAYKSAAGGAGLSAQDVKERIESMGYAGRWANLLASVHTVTKRLHKMGEVEASGNINGKETFRWIRTSAEMTYDAIFNSRGEVSTLSDLLKPQKLVDASSIGYKRSRKGLSDYMMTPPPKSDDKK